MANSVYSFMPNVRQSVSPITNDTYGSLGTNRISFPILIILNGNKKWRGINTQTITDT